MIYLSVILNILLVFTLISRIRGPKPMKLKGKVLKQVEVYQFKTKKFKK